MRKNLESFNFFWKLPPPWGIIYLIGLMSHLSHIKQMYSPTIHLTHEVILSLLITRGRVDFKKDSAVKSPCWQPVLYLSPSDPDFLPFRFGHFHMVWGAFKWPVLSGTLQQSLARCLNTFHTYQEPECIEHICRQSNWLTRSHNGAWLWFLPAAPGVLQQSLIQVLSRPNVA